jgi:hypothetical protein
MVMNKYYYVLLISFLLNSIGVSSEKNKRRFSDKIEIKVSEKKKLITITTSIDNEIELSQMVVNIDTKKVISVPIKSFIVEGKHAWFIESSGIKYDSFKFNFLLKSKDGIKWLSTYTVFKPNEASDLWRAKLLSYKEYSP